MRSHFYILFIVAWLTEATLAFVPSSSRDVPPSRSRNTSCANNLASCTPSTLTTPTTNLLVRHATSTDNPVEITFPTPEDAASMGIRDWPQQFHDKIWVDTVPEGSIATRYVLDGKGRITIDYTSNNGELKRLTNQRVYPGTLIEVDGEANLTWEVDSKDEGMIVLTPSYEEGGKLLLVGGFLLVFCAGLVIGGGGF